MDFFEAQDAARRRTTLLVVLFAVAVLAIIAVVYAAAHVGLGRGGRGVDLLLLLQVAGAVLLVVATGTAIRTASLRKGGPAVAELLGARRIPTSTTDPDERKLVNVVEEMAIASGTGVPAIYVLDREEGINAFAAGYSTHDAAVAVTRGALRSLTRDELQGVIAHEFSHILNGDMRLNIRLIGVLYGILLLAVVGRGIIYAGPRGGRGRSRDAGGWVVILGLALVLVGYIGIFFGKLIKAAVSRQREYLADSAAVQLTRNPEGLAGALRKIGAQASGSRIQDHHAEELSHLFFANGVSRSLMGLLSTHPPLEDRIRRLGSSVEDGNSSDSRLAPARAGGPTAAGRQERGKARPLDLTATVQLAAAAGAVGSVGSPTPEHLAYAASLLDHLPPALARAAHDRDGARALIFALIIAEEGATAPPGARDLVQAYAGAEMLARVEDLLPVIRAQDVETPLALLDLALPALLELPPHEAERFREAVERLIHADGTVRMFDFALIHTLARRLQSSGGTVDRTGRRIRSLKPLRGDVEALLSAIAWAGSEGSAEAAEAAFSAGARRLPSLPAGAIHLQPSQGVGLSRVDEALTALEHAAPAVQRSFLEACAEAIVHDRRTRRGEIELLRAISESLDCPMPPVLAPTPN